MFHTLNLIFRLSPALMIATIVAAQQPSSQQRQAPSPISVQNVKGSIYQVKGGSGANTGFFVTATEVIVIDAKMSEDAARQVLAEIKKVTPNPVRRILLTHSDGDHVNGLVGYPPGIEVIAHENTREHIAKAFESPQPRAYLPSMTFAEKLILRSGDARIDLLYFGPAHTNGDAVIYFPAERVAFIGDLMFLGRDPLIHRAKNGTSFGLVNVLQALLGLDAETYISGHNELMSKKEIEVFLKSVTEKQTKIRSMVNEGKTLDEVKKAFNIETPTGGSRWPSFVEVIYLDIKEKKE